MPDEDIDIPDDTPVFAPDELFTVEEFVSLTLDGWEGARDCLRQQGLDEAADEVDSAIDLLKSTYTVHELMDMAQYEKQIADDDGA